VFHSYESDFGLGGLVMYSIAEICEIEKKDKRKLVEQKIEQIETEVVKEEIKEELKEEKGIDGVL